MKAAAVVSVFLLAEVVAAIQLVQVPDINGNLIKIDISFLLDLGPFDPTDDVYFVLYTRQNQLFGERINSGNIRNSSYHSSYPTRFIIHGWMNSHLSPITVEIKTGYLANNDFNVIAVDWSSGSVTPSYAQARYRVPLVSVVVAKFVNSLISNGFATPDQIIIVGHSFGAHVAGLAAKQIVGEKISAVVGLDAAQPLFSINTPEERLASTDAKYVQVIHTNTAGVFGFIDPIGVADFYPNWGRTQPGCELDLTGTCAHLRVYSFFAESLNNNRYLATQCSSYNDIEAYRCTPILTRVKMGGEPLNRNARGVFYVPVGFLPPYGQGRLL